MNPLSELHPALLQAFITFGLAAVSWLLFRRYRKPYYAWWTIAWLLYSMRLGAIMVFLLSRELGWLWWHQVLTGWTGLALLWSALTFAFHVRWRPWWIAVFLFPPLWSWAAIYEFDNFLLAAIPAVAFLSGVTLGTSWVFLRHWRRVRSTGALILAIAFGLWGLHHLDYPFLRGQGVWVPWGYYVDILFELSVGAGLLVLVLDDLQQGIRTLSTLSVSGAAASNGDPIRHTIEGPLALPTVRGSALFTMDGVSASCLGAAGSCAGWEHRGAGEPETTVIARAMATGRPQYADRWRDPATGGAYRFAAVLPLFRSADATAASSALVIVGDARDPFSALDERFLLALGYQTGIALEREELRRRLEARGAELQRLSVRMIEQHEEERRRISLELHDETAQVFATVKMQLGMIREMVGPELEGELTRALGLIDEGMRSIRAVTHDLRPSLLDDLGLMPALRSLVAEYGRGAGGTPTIDFDAGEPIPSLAPDAELALFRALQELLANVARHSGARFARVRLGVEEEDVVLRVEDDGVGLPDAPGLEEMERRGHLGLAGMRERIAALGGEIRYRRGNGTVIEVRLPAPAPMGTA